MARRTRQTTPKMRDWHLWSEVTRSVSPLHPPVRQRTALPPTPPPPAKPAGAKTQKLPHHRPSLPPYIPGAHVHNRATSTPPGRVIEPNLKRRLVRGHTQIEATIDLHGLRERDAHAALCRFIAARYARGDRTVLVITGKGQKSQDWGAGTKKGILRAMLPIWLAEPALAPMIAGWDAATRAHGGEGAFYVRLRRARQ